jgi:uncharacterized protein Yka (UPF0111/DUF47 family)
MAATGSVSGPLLFAQQLHEHASKVCEGIKLIEPLAEALLVQDLEKMRILHEQVSQIADEADRLKLALYDQAKDAHFVSPGSYAFSRYVGSQNKIIDFTRDFADLLVSRQTAIPDELRGAFGALSVHVATISGQATTLASEFSAPVEADSTDLQGQDMQQAIAAVIEGNRRTRLLEMELARCIHRQESRPDSVTVLAMDRYGMALRKIADAAECAANHLCLLIPRSGVGA